MQLATATRHREGVTLVHLRLANDGRTPRRVRVANRLDGPVRFPRRAGHPVTGWDDGGYEGVLAPGESRALGYACPAEPADPPAEVAWTERAAGPRDPASRAGSGSLADFSSRVSSGSRAGPESGIGSTAGSDPAHAVVWALPDPRPPREAVPVGPGPELLRAPGVGDRPTADPDRDGGGGGSSGDRTRDQLGSIGNRAAGVAAVVARLLAPVGDRLAGRRPSRR